MHKRRKHLHVVVHNWQVEVRGGDEVTVETGTFNTITWIRVRRLKWIGHILRLYDSRLIKQPLKAIFDNRVGDILVNVKETCWHEIEEADADSDKWRMTCTSQHDQSDDTKNDKVKKKESTSSKAWHSKAITRLFTFFPPTSKTKKSQHIEQRKNIRRSRTIKLNFFGPI